MMRKTAFTILELIFVLIVIGILSVVFIPKFGQNKLSQAANQLVSDIRYTQHLAMTDDKYNSNDEYWYRRRWELAFSSADSTQSYYIFSDSPSLTGAYDGNPGANSNYTDVEVAVNPANKHLYMIGVPISQFDNSDTSRLTTRLNLGKTYGITSVSMTGGSSGSSSKRILFDHLGRPYRGSTASTSSHQINSPQDKLATTPIDIVLKNSSGSRTIEIEPETGYTHIL